MRASISSAPAPHNRAQAHVVHNVNAMNTSIATPSARSGTQSIERALLLLRELAARGAAGWGLQDLALHCGLDRGTVHRVLKTLVRERLVEQRGKDRRYVLGPLAFELGASTPQLGDLCDDVRAAVRKLARRHGAMVALGFLRSGDDCVCIARSGAASYTSEGAAIRIGYRAPMLIVASGIAILAAMPPAEMRATVARNRERLAHLGSAHLARLEALARASSRNAGGVLSTGVVWQGIHSAAVAFGPASAPTGSIVLSGAADEFPVDRLRVLLPELREAAALLARRSPPAK